MGTPRTSSRTKCRPGCFANLTRQWRVRLLSCNREGTTTGHQTNKHLQRLDPNSHSDWGHIRSDRSTILIAINQNLSQIFIQLQSGSNSVPRGSQRTRAEAQRRGQDGGGIHRQHLLTNFVGLEPSSSSYPGNQVFPRPL